MKKKTGILVTLAVFLTVILCYGGGSLLYKSYVSKNDEIRYLGHTYRKFDPQVDEDDTFVPYGDEIRLWFLETPKENRFLRMAFTKGDKNRNFIYDHFWNTTVYKRIDFDIPPLAEDLTINKIIVFDRKNKASKMITDKETVAKLVAYYLETEKEYSPYEHGNINAYAFCDSIGGVYELKFEAMNYEGQVFSEAADGRHYLPQEIGEILTS